MIVRCNGCFGMYDDSYDICPECGHYQGRPAKEPYQLVPGIVLENRYIIGNVLGFGGFGVTYKAWDKKLESVVCIKEYYPSGIVNRPPGTSKLILFSGQKKKEFEYGLIRFIDEARNMTKFNAHKNIVNVYEYFEGNNTAYIVMEFLDGCTLSEYMESCGGHLPISQCMSIISCLCRALHDVHENGIIHRDVSPDNVFLCHDGTIKLIDFGAARFSSEEAKNFTIILKPGFAPPEQYEQISDQGPKTDIYALGATLYYMMTGVKPDESTNRKIKDILEEPNHLVKEIPQYINDTILKAMAIEPHLRFESVEEFEKSLHQEIKVTSLKKEKRTKKAKRLIGIATLSLVVLFGATLFGVNLHEKSKQSELKPASIEVWYAAEKDSSVDAAYRKAIKKFNDEYENVKVTIRVIDEASYTAELEKALKANKGPNLFVSNSLSKETLKKTADLSTVVIPDSQNNKMYYLINILTKGISKSCYFFDDYQTYFPGSKQIPVGFNVPVVYVNTSLAKNFELDEIASLDEISNYLQNGNEAFVSAEKASTFQSIFGAGLNEKAKTGTAEQFAAGKCAFYFSDTGDFFACRKIYEDGIGTFKVVPIKKEKLPCSFATCWSVRPTNENADAAAIRLLGDFLSDYDQTTIYGKKDLEHALPLNKDSLKRFVSEDGYVELSFIEDYVKEYSF